MITVVRILARRVLLLVPLMLGIVLFVFLVMRFSDVDPASAFFQGANPTAQQLHDFREQNGLLDPLPVRYVVFIGDLVHGDMGTSALTRAPVVDQVMTALPLTIQLTFLGLGIAVVLSLVGGVTAAIYRDRLPDQIIRVVSLTGVAAPGFWLALLMIQYLAVDLGWFPTGGYINPADSFTGWLKTMTLPALALSLPVAAQLTRIVRTSVVEELDKDYVRTAIGSGLPPRVVVGRNVLRNALINPLTVLGLRVGYLLGGAVVIETIFSLPGMGKLMIDAVKNGDPAVVQGVVITTAIGFVVVNLVIDILYLLVNPRLREAT
ncbi:ABC transporter permease [Streptomyces sp. HUAS 31]|uniref:ABC transporter permease n=1 Tax=Streptomyces osmaniensis TaxID=593134 RepID=A0ABP6V1W4_9ACTN|nr:MULTISPECIES: ABC transporter permease [unclassified Streptomyces]MCZ4603359.1 ABC transporter permease [Streptomyces sp. Lzd4kr]WCD96740.1 ABC transporter permease [Streptomyces sp. HUAS 31]SEC42409.1 peptide/nickel transport system permease protein [Streptomyces sp. PAN_FS17]SED40772.1 peptide/nickel transport system permease protein [Streptomyces sp. KS_5]